MTRPTKGVSFAYEHELAVAPLTDDEKRWINRLQRCLASCPKRLELTTVGDPSLTVVDISEKGIDAIVDSCGGANGVVVARVIGGPTVHGICG